MHNNYILDICNHVFKTFHNVYIIHKLTTEACNFSQFIHNTIPIIKSYSVSLSSPCVGQVATSLRYGLIRPYSVSLSSSESVHTLFDGFGGGDTFTLLRVVRALAAGLAGALAAAGKPLSLRAALSVIEQVSRSW